jgi:hypothetical protein
VPLRAQALLTWILTAAVLAFAVRTLYTAVAWFTHTGGIQRFHVETSAAWLVGLAVILLFLKRLPARVDERAPGAPGADVRTCAIWCAMAVAVFAPALSVGFLSDDFVLVERARHAQFGFFNAEAFRPVPLMVWSALLAVGANATLLHVLNVLLHGANAFLTYRIASAFVPRRWAIAAGALMLTFPLAPEAVVWCFGVFDVSATFFVLLTILVARGYTGDATWRRRLAFFATAIVAVLCKETALVTAVLVGLDAWARATWPRRLVRDAAILLAASVAVVAGRLVLAPEIAKEPLTRYTLQRWLFGTVGGLAAPVHVDVVRAAAWLPSVEAALLVALVTLFALRRHPASVLRPVAAYALFALVATLPAVGFFSIGPDLQQSRYLYLSTVGYACAIVGVGHALMERRGAAWTYAAATLVALLVTMHVVNLQWNDRLWVQAGRLRDRIMGAVLVDAATKNCPTMSLAGMPDNYRGAYVFRNGSVEAFRAVGVTIDPNATSGECLFRWTQVGR